MKGWKARSLVIRNEEGNESANHKGGFLGFFFTPTKPDLPPCWDFDVLKNIFFFELERRKVRDEGWRRDEELVQDRIGATMGGGLFLCSVRTTLMKYLWAIKPRFVTLLLRSYILHTSKWHTVCLLGSYSLPPSSKSFLSLLPFFSSPPPPFLSLRWGCEGCGRGSWFYNGDLSCPHFLLSHLLTVTSSTSFFPLWSLKKKALAQRLAIWGTWATAGTLCHNPRYTTVSAALPAAFETTGSTELQIVPATSPFLLQSGLAPILHSFICFN